MEGFLHKLRIKVIRDKCAYLLNEFLEDIKILSEENGLQEPVIKNTTTLKRKILEKYGDDISFFPKGKFLLVHASDMDPCEYAIAALHGYGLRDEDLARSFGNMIKRKIKIKHSASYEWKQRHDKYAA